MPLSLKKNWKIPALVLLWGIVIYRLGAQWMVFEQYSYGWSVPVLCAYLFWNRWPSRPAPRTPESQGAVSTVMVLAALSYLPTILLNEANPTWRVPSLFLAIEIVSITLGLLYLTAGRCWLAHFCVPVLFFLVAVPWPTAVEQAIIQNLTRLNVSGVVELLGFLGIPAMASGNVIEVATGRVGVDEACSGIRSVQATLMIALFFGELYRLSGARRLALCFAGMALSFIFNLGRTMLLTWVAAREGLPAIDKWHDPAGVIILVCCFCGLWGVSQWFRKIGAGEHGHPMQDDAAGSKKEGGGSLALNVQSLPGSNPGLPNSLSAALVVWIILCELGVEMWFRYHEVRDHQTIEWAIRWPERNPTCHLNKIPKTVHDQLQYDSGSSASWSDEAGSLWQGFYFRWRPAQSLYGRMRVALSKFHHPETCLSGAGLILREEFDPVILEVDEKLGLAFRRYLFEEQGRYVHVFFAVLEDQTPDGDPGYLRKSSWERVVAALGGSRNYGQRSVEIVIQGVTDPEEALRLMRSEIRRLVLVEDKSTAVHGGLIGETGA